MRRPGLVSTGLVAVVVGACVIILSQVGFAGYITWPPLLWSILRDLGIGLAGAGVIVITVDLWTDRHILNRMENFRDQLRRDIFFAMFDRLVPKEISAEIGLHIGDDPILYRGFRLVLTLHDVDGGLGGPSVASFKVINESERSAAWHYYMRISDVTAGGRPTPNTVQGFSVKSSKVPENNISLTSPAQLRKHIEQDLGLGVTEFRFNFSLEPHEELDVEVTRQLLLRRRDTYSLNLRHPTIDLRVEVYFPNGYRCNCTFAHPSQNDPTRCSFRSGRDAGGVAVAEIVGGILPYQGLTLDWIRTEDEDGGISP